MSAIRGHAKAASPNWKVSLMRPHYRNRFALEQSRTAGARPLFHLVPKRERNAAADGLFVL